jgi:PAS domain S-box-containing protein
MDDALRILLVDDDAVSRITVQHSLHQAGVQLQEVVEVGTYSAAIATLEQGHFDCAILDYYLPDGNGLQLVKYIRNHKLPVALIVLTGQGDEQLAVKSMKAGANDYLSKSDITSEELSRRLWQSVRLHRAELLAQEVTTKLFESEERYRLVLEGSTDGIWDWNICKNEVFCNDRLLEILGIPRSQIGTAYDTFLRLIHPEDQLHVQQAIQFHLLRNSPFEVEFRLQHINGDYRHCTARGKAQRDSQGNLLRMSGIIHDITQRKIDEQKIVQLNRDLERRVIELQTVLDVIPVGIAIAKDIECSNITVNSYMGTQLGLSPYANALENDPTTNPLPYKLYQAGQELDLTEFPMQRSAATGTPISNMEYDVVHANGRRLNVLAEVAPLFDESNRSRGCVGAFLDITERKKTEDAQRFLANASALLATSLDAQTILESLAQLTVPYLADWCLIHTMQDDNLRLVALHHADPTQVAAFQKVRRRYPLTLHASNGIAEVLRTGESKFYPTLSLTDLATLTDNDEHRELIQPFGFQSALVVPLLARGRTLGVITLVYAESGRHYSPQDLELAEDLARRSALVIDNARLYQSTQRAEQNLRQAVLILGEHQQQLRTLQNLTDLLNQRLTDLPGLLQAMMDAVCAAIPGAEFGLIMLHNPYTNQLEITATIGLEQTAFPFHETLEQVFLTGDAYVMVDGEEQGEAPSSDLSFLCAIAIASQASVEIASQTSVEIASNDAGRLGVLAVGSWSNRISFNDEDMRLLMAFSEQAAIALNNAQLIHALEEREERLAHQNGMLIRQNQELENQRQQIELQNLKLTEAAQLKSQFLATMSHELRTPMNAIMGFSQLLLRQKSLGSQPAEMVNRILNNSKSLLALINDILDLSKIEAGRLKLKLTRFNLSSLLLSTTEEVRSLADQKNLILRSESHLTNPWVVNDRDRVRQVLNNLLSNAIKFTDTGRVEVTIRELAPDQIIISVQDTGVGIAQTELEHIFEEFRQVDQSIARKHPGTGLGLAITKWLVHMMQGSISVESQVRQGSTFSVELPREVGVN